MNLRTNKIFTQSALNGLAPGDIVGYKNLTVEAKRKAQARATKTIKNLVEGKTETSVLPPRLINQVWHNLKFIKCKPPELVMWKAYDGGTHFRLKEKTEGS